MARQEMISFFKEEKKSFDDVKDGIAKNVRGEIRYVNMQRDQYYNFEVTSKYNLRQFFFE